MTASPLTAPSEDHLLSQARAAHRRQLWHLQLRGVGALVLGGVLLGLMLGRVLGVTPDPLRKLQLEELQLISSNGIPMLQLDMSSAPHYSRLHTAQGLALRFQHLHSPAYQGQTHVQGRLVSWRLEPQAEGTDLILVGEGLGEDYLEPRSLGRWRLNIPLHHP